MDTFTLEISVHRIAGTDRYERTFMPRVEQIYPKGLTSSVLPGLLFGNAMVRVEFSRWTLVRPALWSAEMRLSDTNGCQISPPRPTLVSALPCDVPLYSTHIATDPEHGVYSVGLRVPQGAWTAEDLETAAEGVAA